MMKISFKSAVLAAVVGVAGTLATITGASAQEFTLKLHQFLPAQAHVPKNVLDVWADNVERDSGGRIKI